MFFHFKITSPYFQLWNVETQIFFQFFPLKSQFVDLFPAIFRHFRSTPCHGYASTAATGAHRWPERNQAPCNSEMRQRSPAIDRHFPPGYHGTMLTHVDICWIIYTYICIYIYTYIYTYTYIYMYIVIRTDDMHLDLCIHVNIHAWNQWREVQQDFINCSRKAEVSLGVFEGHWTVAADSILSLVTRTGGTCICILCIYVNMYICVYM